MGIYHWAAIAARGSKGVKIDRATTARHLSRPRIICSTNCSSQSLLEGLEISFETCVNDDHLEGSVSQMFYEI